MSRPPRGRRPGVSHDRPNREHMQLVTRGSIRAQAASSSASLRRRRAGAPLGARRYGIASICARLTRLRVSLLRRRSQQGAQRISTFATRREPPFENGTIWSYSRLSLSGSRRSDHGPCTRPRNE